MTDRIEDEPLDGATSAPLFADPIFTETVDQKIAAAVTPLEERLAELERRVRALERSP